MGNVKPGEYFLRLAAEPSPLVGVNGDSAASYPVFTDPANKIWTVSQTDRDGNYTLSLRGIVPLFAKDSGGTVVAGPDSGPSPPSVWVIDGPEGGPSIIRVPGTNKAWTVLTPYAPVANIFLEDEIKDPQVPENQKWYFISYQK